MRELLTDPAHRPMVIFLVLMILIGIPSIYLLEIGGFVLLAIFTLVYWFGLSIFEMLRKKSEEDQ